MDTEITLLHLVVTVAGSVFAVIGTLLSVFLPLFRRNDRAAERLEEKLDHSVERLNVKLDHSVERLNVKLDHSVKQLRADTKELNEKLERSTKELNEKLERSTKELDEKLERLRIQLYNLNGKVNRLIGHVFGVGTQIEEDDEETEQLAVKS